MILHTCEVQIQTLKVSYHSKAYCLKVDAPRRGELDMLRILNPEGGQPTRWTSRQAC